MSRNETYHDPELLEPTLDEPEPSLDFAADAEQDAEEDEAEAEELPLPEAEHLDDAIKIYLRDIQKTPLLTPGVKRNWPARWNRVIVRLATR